MGSTGNTGRWLACWVAGALGLTLVAGCELDADRGTATRSAVEVASPSGGADDAAHPTEEDELALRILMEARAKAVKSDDLKAFKATVDRRQPKLLAAQTTLFRNMAALPIGSLQYDVATVYLTPAPVPGKDPVLHPQVIEHLALEGTTSSPISNKLDLTFVLRGDRWLVGAERKPGAKGSVEDPQERPWFGVPIAVHHRGKLTVLVDASNEDQLDGLVATVQDGVRRDADILGVSPNDKVLVDATSNGLSQDFGAGVKEEVGATTFPLLVVDVAGKAVDVAGVAIKINPGHVGELIESDRLLWHELTHYLLFRHTLSSPAWLSEGVAAWVQYQPARLSQLVVPDELYQRAQRPPRVLPTEGTFYGEPDVNYLLAQAAVQWLVDRSGTGKLLELMKAFGRAGGTPDAATPKALREVYKISERELFKGTWETLSSVHH